MKAFLLSLIILNSAALYPLHLRRNLTMKSGIFLPQIMPSRSFKTESQVMLWNARYLDACERKSTFEQRKILEKFIPEVNRKEEYYQLRQGTGVRTKLSIVIEKEKPEIIAEASYSFDDESSMPTIEEVYDRSRNRLTPFATDLLFFVMLKSLGEQKTKNSEYTHVLMKPWYFGERIYPFSLSEKLKKSAELDPINEYFDLECKIPIKDFLS